MTDQHMRLAPRFSAFLLLFSTFLLAAPSSGEAHGALRADEDDPAAAARIVERVRGALVRVEHHLRQHQGERPDAPVSGDPFSIGSSAPRENADALIGDERPLESPGYLLEPTLVLAMDIPLHERFVERIRVRFGGDVVDATVHAWMLDDAAVMLRLARPLEGAVPLALAEPGSTPTRSVRWLRTEGSWIAEARPFVSREAFVDDGVGGHWRTTTAPGTLMVDDDGKLVGATMRGSFVRDRSLFGDPRAWPALDRAEREALLRRTAERADASIVRATLQFRSPRLRGGQQRFSPYRGDGDGIETELQSLAVRLAGSGAGADGSGVQRAVILAALPPSATARLEGITLHLADGSTATAEFESTLRDVGAFTATINDVSDGGVTLTQDGVLAWRDRLLPTALVRTTGRQRALETGHARFERFAVGWRGVVFPAMVPEVDRTFVFSRDGDLVALPLVRRIPAADRDRWRGLGWTLMPATVLSDALTAGSAAIDPSNIPLDEEEEARTAWLGVIMQALEKDLADALGVAEQTLDGQFGGLIAAVFENSPADRAGLMPGAVVLAIHSPNRPRPIQIVVDESELGYPGAFPWERLDEVPEEFFDQIPTPWPTIEDLTSRALAELGFGSEFELEVVIDGQTRRMPMVVEQSPPHYGNAPRHEEERLGLTVRNLSFEIRSHLRLGDDEPGVVVANLKPGGRASLAGLRPFEIIVEVDGEPVADAAAFGELVKDKTELRLAVRRGTRSRVVRLSD